MKNNHTNGQIDQMPSSPSPIARILSGSVGSIVYVCAFNPLEVVKIRQQAATTVGSKNASAAAVSSSLALQKPSSVKAYLKGRGAVILNNGLMVPKSAFPCLVAPQYRVSTPNIFSQRFESTTRQIIPYNAIIGKSKQQPVGGIIKTLLSISRTEGRAGLYAGLRPTLLAAVPNTAIYFTAYDEISMRLKRRYNLRNADNQNTSLGGGDIERNAKQSVFIPLVSGATARLIASVATAPLELVRTRQASAIGNKNGILEEFRFITRIHGPLALYRGLGPMIMRDVPFSAMYFLGLETFKGVLSKSSVLGTWGVHHYQNNHDMKAPAGVEVMHSFLSASAAGAIAVIFTTPFDLVKTRRQVAQQSERTSPAIGHRGTFHYMKQIVQEEGFFAGLWRGNYIRMVKVVPGTAVMISCYELGKILSEGVL